MGLRLFVVYRGSSCALYPELLRASSLLVVFCEFFCLELWDFLEILNEHVGLVVYEYYCYVYLKY